MQKGRLGRFPFCKKSQNEVPALRSGEVSEWPIEPVSKTGVPFVGTAGSNPALSVTYP